MTPAAQREESGCAIRFTFSPKLSLNLNRRRVGRASELFFRTSKRYASKAPR